MKKNILLGLASCLLAAACAGNPPAWWNPGNVYSSEAPARTSASKGTNGGVSSANTVAVQEAEPVVKEESIAPLPDESYEEMILTPLQDEETENASGESSAQSAPAETGLLPPPSVLE